MPVRQLLFVITAVTLSIGPAHATQVQSSIVVSATVMPAYGVSVNDATVTVVSCPAACSIAAQPSMATPDLTMQQAGSRRLLTPLEQQQLGTHGIAGLAQSLRRTAAADLTIISFDF